MNPASRQNKVLIDRKWRGAQGLADDVRYYARWMRDEAEKRFGHLYPKVEVTSEMVKMRPDLKLYVRKKLTVIAWLWARTVKSPNPAFAHIDVPLASTFVLSSKAGMEAYLEPIVEADRYRIIVKVGKPKEEEATKRGTKSGSSGSSFFCLMSGAPMPFEYIRSEAIAKRMGIRLLAIVAEGNRGRVYLPPTAEMEDTALKAKPIDVPDSDLPEKALGFRIQEYGMTKWCDLFTDRQLLALTTFSKLVQESREQVLRDALAAGLLDDGLSLEAGGRGAAAYADSITVYLACLLDRMVYYGSSLTTWLPKDNALRDCMPRQALSMVWDFAEGNPFGKSSCDVLTCANSVANYLELATPFRDAVVTQSDARIFGDREARFLVSTDPPYYDNIGYADLSEYFYVWLRRSLKPIFPHLFATVAVPKAEELVADPYRHGGKEQAEAFFLEGMTQAMHRLAAQADPDFPITIYYAFKQSETDDDEGTTSTGWETFLEALMRAGLSVQGTWPIRTEGAGRMRASDSNALASSIVLVCRRRAENAPLATRREFLIALKAELPLALIHLQHGNIAPVDLAQTAIGPGMAVYTRYAKVIDAAGNLLTVREALALINQALDEVLAEQENDFDADSRWALAWFGDHGFAEGPFGDAHTYFLRFNTAENALKSAGIIESGRGKVRLLRPDELPADWDPESDPRLTAWESVHHLVRVLEAGGENAAAGLVAKLGSKAEIARELAYRLYTVCERKKRAQEALSYNALVQSWPEITRLAREGGKPQLSQPQLFSQE